MRGSPGREARARLHVVPHKRRSLRQARGRLPKPKRELCLRRLQNQRPRRNVNHLQFSPLQPWRRQANNNKQQRVSHLQSSVDLPRLTSLQQEGWSRHPLRRKPSLQPENLQLVRRKLSRAVESLRQCLLHLPLVRPTLSSGVHRSLQKVQGQLQCCPLSAKLSLEDQSSLLRECEEFTLPQQRKPKQRRRRLQRQQPKLRLEPAKKLNRVLQPSRRTRTRSQRYFIKLC